MVSESITMRCGARGDGMVANGQGFWCRIMGRPLGGRRTAWMLPLVLVFLFAGCSSPTPRASDTPAAPAPAQQPSGPKVLTIAIQGEPTSFDADLTGASSGRNLGGVTNVRYIAHDML